MTVPIKRHDVPAELASDTAIALSGVSVRFKIQAEKISSFKEYVLKWLRGHTSARDLWALRDVDLKVRRGEVFGVAGRNGAGKSTLLKLVARVLEPTAGRLIVRGRVAPMLDLGAGFHPDLTGEENVALYGGLLGHRPAELAELLQSIVEFAELEGRMHLPVRQYSSGMLARLGFAVATAVRPDILLVDEVLAVGDAEFQEKCLARVRKFRELGTTILLVTHAESAFSHCDRALLLRDGQVKELGSAEDIWRLYRRRPVDVVNADADDTDEIAVDAIDDVVSDDEPEIGPETTPEDAAESDDRLIRSLRQRCDDPRSVFCAFRLFAEIRDVAIRHRLDLDRVLELGPGGLPGVSFCMLAGGSSRASTTGRGLLQPFDEEFFEQMKDYLGAVGGFGWWRYGADLYDGLDLSSPICWNDVDAGKLGDRIEILDSSGDDLAAIPDASFTFAFSSGSFEHREDPESTVRELRRILAPGGGMVHEINLAPVDDPNPLADLELSEESYARALRERPAGFRQSQLPPGVKPHEAFQNRWRASDYRHAFEQAGFRILDLQPVVIYRPERIDLEALAEPFRSRSREDLSILVVRIAAMVPS